MGPRTLEFDGEILAHSDSKRPNAFRWVEFTLYLTVAGTYVLERVGQTQVFHTLECEVVERNKLKFNPEDHLESFHVPCDECNPFDDDDLIIEKPRYYAVVSESPNAILKALYKKDKDGTRYMTYVTSRLLEEASEKDLRLQKAYQVEYIS